MNLRPKRLVIAVSSSALFDMRQSDAVFQKGQDDYRNYQLQHIQDPLGQGVAYPFIRRLLSLNEAFPEERPVEVVLFSRNSPETGLRAFRSVQHYNLDISKAYFSSGRTPYHFLPSFHASLFLSANEEDTRQAIAAGYAAGTVLNANQAHNDDDNERELRIAFDFDGVAADDTAEQFFKATGDIHRYLAHENALRNTPLGGGPIAELLRKISFFQRLERRRADLDSSYKPIVRTTLITARSAPAHERVVTTLRNLRINADEAFFLGGGCKADILKVLKPHIFFDDQLRHLEGLGGIPAVHIPFGIVNKQA